MAHMAESCSLMELNGLIQVSLDTPLLESDLKADGKVVEKQGSTIMRGGTVQQCSSMVLNSLIKVTRGPPLLKSVAKADGKIVQR
jgi:hypothetical protein